MARRKDEARRTSILNSAKKLFAEKGFHGTSVADIVQATGFPAGSIYTYFSGKEEIVRDVIEEGWNEFLDGLRGAVATCRGPQEKLAVLIDQALPSLFADIDLIDILLSEALRYADIDKKLDPLTDLIADIIREAGDTLTPRDTLKTGLVVIFLGVLNTIRIGKSSSFSISEREVIAFVRDMAVAATANGGKSK